VEGAEAQPQAGGRVLITTGRLQTFREPGIRELFAEAPSCTYATGPQILSSPGPIRAEAGEGKFRFEGQGFMWQHTNSWLVISNNVRTWVRADALNPAKAGQPFTEADGIVITSRRFEYDVNTGAGVYLDDVRVDGTNLNLTAGVLRLLVTSSDDRKLREVGAEQDAVVDYAGVHVSGQRAVYSTESQRVEVSGDPRWKSGFGEGSGDQLIVDRTNGVFYVLGDARVNLPVEAFASSCSRAGSSTNRTVEILSRSYEVRTNEAVFRDNVEVTLFTPEGPSGEMSADVMRIFFTGTNELQHIEAEGAVELRREGVQFTAGKAFYSATNGVLSLTRNPLWFADRRSGGGTRIDFEADANRMNVISNAWMQLPAAELAEYGKKMGSAGPFSGALGEDAGDARITSEQYAFSEVNAFFRGNVRVQHPRMWWTCGDVRIDFPKEAGRADRMLARGAVMFEVTDRRGQVLRGIGEQASYVYGAVPGLTNEFVELSGIPAVLSTTNATARNPRFVIDLVRHTVSVPPGGYAISGTNLNAPPMPSVPTTELLNRARRSKR
jgi:lipopolysaccharide export system protein LptA